MYLLKIAIRPWRQAPWSQLMSSLATGVLLLLLGFITWMHAGLNPLLARFQTEQILTAYIGPSVQKKDEAQLVDTIRATLGAAAVREIEVVDSQGFVSQIKKRYPDLGEELEALGTEMESIVPRYVSVSGAFGESAIDRLRALPGVESAESSKDRYSQAIGAFTALQWAARLFGAGLCLALFTGLVHLSRMNAEIHAPTLSLLRLWGASGSAIRVPGALSGLLIGLVGGGIAFVGWALAGSRMSGHLAQLSPLLRELPQATPAAGLALLATGVVLGAASGLIGSFWGTPAAGKTTGAGGAAWG